MIAANDANPLAKRHPQRAYCLGRSYDPTIARFTSMDSIYVQPGDMENADLYTYVADNPVNMSDPTGHDVSGTLTVLDIMSSLIGTVQATAGPATRPPLAGDPQLHGGIIPNEDYPQAPPVDFNDVIKDELGGRLTNRKLVDALNRIFNTSVGERLLKQLRADRKVVRIQRVGNVAGETRMDDESPDPQSNDPGHRLLRINTSQQFYYLATDNSYHPFTVERILAHELGHSAGALDDGPDSMNNINTWENPIMSEISRFARSNYHAYVRKGDRFELAG